MFRLKLIPLIFLILFLRCSTTSNLTFVEYNLGFVPKLIREKPIYMFGVNTEEYMSDAAPDSIFLAVWENYLPYVRYELNAEKTKNPSKNLFRKIEESGQYRYILIPYLKFSSSESDKIAVQLDIKVWDVTLEKLVWHTTDIEQDKLIDKAIRKACAISIKALPCYLNMGRPWE